jgi:LPS export ABC transporter protein LptC
MAVFLSAAMFFFISCKDDPKNAVNLNYDSEKMPSLNTDSVTMLISDSGLIRYKMITKTWEVFDKAKDPHWLFPHGFYAEQLDTAFNIVLTVKSDTAWSYTNRKIWKLKGHVSILNVVGETFSGDELFWDERRQRIYSDKYVEVYRPDKMTLKGTGGFEANQQMTEYKFLNVKDSPITYNEDQENNSDSENTEEKENKLFNYE